MSEVQFQFELHLPRRVGLLTRRLTQNSEPVTLDGRKPSFSNFTV
jgi:hypothetical protein